MKNTLVVLFFIFFSCTKSKNTEKSIEIPSIEKSQIIETNEEILVEDEEKIINEVENIFFNSLKQYDKETNKNNLDLFKNIFDKHKITAYDLYVELTNINKKADIEARKVGVEIKANGNERINERYYLTYNKIKKESILNLQSKYGLNDDLLMLFQNNYCFCYVGNQDVICKEGKCILTNGEYWEN